MAQVCGGDHFNICFPKFWYGCHFCNKAVCNWNYICTRPIPPNRRSCHVAFCTQMVTSLCAKNSQIQDGAPLRTSERWCGVAHCPMCSDWAVRRLLVTICDKLFKWHFWNTSGPMTLAINQNCLNNFSSGPYKDHTLVKFIRFVKSHLKSLLNNST